jgi:Protein of unknown function (DUF3606)
MPDNKNKTDQRDRSRVAAKQQHEVQFFAQEAGISMEQARDLIDRFGHDRETLMREAGRMLKQMS